jgi:L-amino acid N-acyltransferase YncA
MELRHAQPNEGSVALHRSLGMVEVGKYHGVGFKDGV